MNNKLFKVISITLMLIIITISSPYSYSDAVTSPPRYENSGREFLDETKDPVTGKITGTEIYENIKSQLPTLPDGSKPLQWIILGEHKLYLNLRLWNDEGVVCYGNYKNVPQNYQKDFHLGTQPPGMELKTGDNDGYYPPVLQISGKRGEWRYHGYDVNGSKLSNLYFSPDSIVTEFDEREWIKDPWDSNKITLNRRPTKSDFNKAAKGDVYVPTLVQSRIQAWINKSMDKYNGVPLLGKTIDPEVYNYLNVESAPTIKRIGQGRMWHIRPNNSIWYQTVAVPTLGPKQNPPVTATITPLNVLSGEDVGVAMDNQSVTLQYKVSAILDDTTITSDYLKQTVYYYRDDIKNWEFTFTPPSDLGTTITKTNVSKVDNTGSYIFSITTTYGRLKNRTGPIHLTATAQPAYLDGNRGIKGNAVLDDTIHFTPVPPPSPPPINGATPVVIDVPIIDVNSQIGEIAYDGVPFSDAVDNTDMTAVTSVEVYVNGDLVDYDTFFSGYYVFPAVPAGNTNGYMAEISCRYNLDKSQIKIEGLTEADKALIMSTTPVQYESIDYVYVYPTKPIANFSITSNTWRENRLIKVQDTSAAGNIQLVVQKYPIVQYEWTCGGDTTQLRYGTNTDLSKELLYKKPGVYSLTLRVKNSLGKWSDPYTVSYQVLEDVPPAVGVNLNESVYTRNDKVSAWYYSVASTDGDTISSSSIELWYDSNNDGTLDQKLNTWNNQAQFPNYTPTKLGYYKYIVKAQEDFTTDTLAQHITAADKKSASYSVEFWVDNYQPLSDIYVNIPIQRPNIDVYIMLDKNLDITKKDYILNNRVNMSNWLLGKNIIPNVNIWDMRTYTYSQVASTSINTGGTYPAASTPYSSNGYSGTLNLASTTNNRYSVDYGHYTPQTESKTATGTATGYNNVYYTAGKWGGWVQTGADGSNTPSIPYSDSQGFSGTLSKTSYTTTKDNGAPTGTGTPGSTYTWHREYLAYYSGTVTRTVQVWVPNVVWYDNYTGYYSGTIYKNVRQPYTDTFNPTSLKYIVYISDSTVSELNDLNMVMGYASSAKLLLAGTNAITSQRTYDNYFDVSGKTIDAVANEILQYVAVSSPAVEQYYVLQDETFSMNVGEVDLENDPISIKEMLYVHDQSYYDNPTGKETGTVSVYSNTAGWINSSDPSAIKSSLHNVGKYTIYRRVKDNPSSDPNFAGNSYYSSPTFLEVYVVRKPIAKAILDWDYDTVSSTYKTTWVDQSYDPDHQFSRPDKGIVDRNIKWRRTGGEWHYGIPDNLAPGTYELNYYVKDLEGYWSDPFTLNFALDPAPSMQFDASLRTLENKYSLESIPASECLEAFNMWTRYPYNVYLQLGLYSGSSLAAPVKTIYYNVSTGVKNGNDIVWNDVPYQLPDALQDGTYVLKVSAFGDYGQNSYKSFFVTVNTPISLKGYINNAASNAEIQADSMNTFTFTTSRYVSTVQLIFKGQAYSSSSGAVKLISSDSSAKTWEIKLDIPSNTVMDNETGFATFAAWTLSGKSETVNVNYKILAIRAYDFTITSIQDISWRGYYFDLANPINGDGERYGYPRKTNTDIKTLQMPVNSLGLIPYTQNSVAAGYRIKGHIRIKGFPDSADLIGRYTSHSMTKLSNITLSYVDNDKYAFEWIIPQDTDSNSYVGFDVLMRKGSNTYGNEKWQDIWASGNSSHWAFLVKGTVLDDIIFNQSN